MKVIKSLSILALVAVLGSCVTETTTGLEKADSEKRLNSHIELGVGYLRNRNYQRAKESLQRALEIDSQSAKAHNYFGLLYQLELDPEMAEEHYKKAIRYDPSLASARNNYGAFLFEQGRYEEAIVQLKEAASDKLYRNRSHVYENLGISYLRLGQREEARKAFHKSIALNPNQSRALLELAQLYFEDRNYVDAKKLYNRHKKVSGPSAQSLWLGIRLARIFGNEDEEASLALALKNIFPASPQYQAYKRTTAE